MNRWTEKKSIFLFVFLIFDFPKQTKKTKKKKKNSSDNNIWPSFVRVFGSLVSSMNNRWFICWSQRCRTRFALTRPIDDASTGGDEGRGPVRTTNNSSSIWQYSLNLSFVITHVYGWLLHPHKHLISFTRNYVPNMFEPEPKIKFDDAKPKQK